MKSEKLLKQAVAIFENVVTKLNKAVEVGNKEIEANDVIIAKANNDKVTASKSVEKANSIINSIQKFYL